MSNYERRTCDVCSRKIEQESVLVMRNGLTFVLCHRSSCKRRFEVQHPVVAPTP